MSVKSILKKSALVAATTIATVSTSSAKLQYSVGVGYGMGLFEFNGSKENSTFQGNTNVTLPIGVANPYPIALRTTYKYVGNLPQKIFHAEAGVVNTFDNITFLDRAFFLGATLGFGWGKTSGADGLLNPKANYANTGSTAIFFSLNSKFGFENSFSKIYGLFGATMAKADLPYDILPLGYYPNSPDIITCTTAQNGDLINSLLALQAQGAISIGPILGGSVQNLQTFILNACNGIKVDDASYTAWFLNLGAGTEVNITKNLTLFAEYTHMFQLDKDKIYSVDYTMNGQKGTFKGKIVTTNVDYIKAGFRYYFG